jgi:hypothetical protein
MLMIAKKVFFYDEGIPAKLFPNTDCAKPP